MVLLLLFGLVLAVFCLLLLGFILIYLSTIIKKLSSTKFPPQIVLHGMCHKTHKQTCISIFQARFEKDAKKGSSITHTSKIPQNKK